MLGRYLKAGLLSLAMLGAGFAYDDVTLSYSENLVSNVSAPLVASILGLVLIVLGRRKVKY